MTMKKTDKDFDSVVMKRRAARAIYQRLQDKSLEERLAYWQERTEALQRRKKKRASWNQSP